MHGKDLHGKLRYKDHHGAGILAVDFEVNDPDLVTVTVFKNYITVP